MLGYFLYKDRMITIEVDEYYFKPMVNPQTAKYTSKWFKVIHIRKLNGEEVNSEEVNELDDYVRMKNCSDGTVKIKHYFREVEYFWSEQQILDSLPKENGFCRFYYDSGKLKERYFMMNGIIVEGTHHKY
jgi:hypothetical protein